MLIVSKLDAKQDTVNHGEACRLDGHSEVWQRLCNVVTLMQRGNASQIL